MPQKPGIAAAVRGLFIVVTAAGGEISQITLHFIDGGYHQYTSRIFDLRYPGVVNRLSRVWATRHSLFAAISRRSGFSEVGVSFI